MVFCDVILTVGLNVMVMYQEYLTWIDVDIHFF